MTSPEMRNSSAPLSTKGRRTRPAALILVVSAEIDRLGRPAPRLFLVDEFRHNSWLAQQKLTDSELARDLVRWLNDRHLPASTSARLLPRFTIADPSAA